MFLLAALRQAGRRAQRSAGPVPEAHATFSRPISGGISAQLQQAAELNETISQADFDFRTSKLKTASLIRLGYLAVLPRSEFRDGLGAFLSARLNRLLTRLADFFGLKFERVASHPTWDSDEIHFTLI